ncbi:MAG: 3-phosphoserine/phosphohydroxythreonine transaminase, partial [Bacteroidaceae bacterium]|nr:3-phosphoserine/phosphohydroxythreonine transaminase [Bacteroidaceae bacterium]
SKEYQAIIDSCEASLREVMNIPDNYKVLFLQGGASMQFAMIHLNLMKKGKADFVVTGQWATKAYKEAQRFGTANAVASSKDKTFSYIPELDSSKFDKDADYFHICLNNTIYGTKFPKLPETGDVPLVADMSSCILSEPVDVIKFGLIYAGAQKNMGPAGLTVVIIREDLIREFPEDSNVPTMLQYKTHADNGSMFNTPPVVPIYSALMNLRYMKAHGGVVAMQKLAEQRAEILYAEIDRNKMFVGTAEKDSRSLMNITFVLKPEYQDLQDEFLKFATSQGMVGVKGHRDVGGFRASCYNAMSVEGVQALVKCMQEFDAQH